MRYALVLPAVTVLCGVAQADAYADAKYGWAKTAGKEAFKNMASNAGSNLGNQMFQPQQRRSFDDADLYARYAEAEPKYGWAKTAGKEAFRNMASNAGSNLGNQMFQPQQPQYQRRSFDDADLYARYAEAEPKYGWAKEAGKEAFKNMASNAGSNLGNQMFQPQQPRRRDVEAYALYVRDAEAYAMAEAEELLARDAEGGDYFDGLYAREAEADPEAWEEWEY